MINYKIAKKSEQIIVSVYNSMVNYNDFTYELSEHDYKVIAAGSTGVFENNATNFDWKYTINHIHTLSWGTGAYSYINDSCDIFCTDGTHYAGYTNRNIRLKWKFNIKKGKYEVVNVYEYITPGPLNAFFDMFS